MAVETITMSLHHPLPASLFGKQEAKIKDLPKFDASSIRRICKIGSGCHSSVYLVTTPSREQLALKCLNLNTIPNQELYASLTYELMAEACILAGLDHENIIKIRGLSCTSLERSMGYDPSDSSDDPSESDVVGSRPFFLMDVLSETLMDRVQRWSNDNSNYKVSRLFFLGNRSRKLDIKKMIGRVETTAIGVARGMAYLHNKGIVLQDLKPANIGFDIQTGQTRIFDFGMARHVLDLSIYKATVEICGTPRYMAPEIMNGETATKASDVYSFGCVLYTLCTLKVPFHDFASKEDELEEFKAIVVSGQRPCLRCIPSVAFRDLIEDCWAQDPFDRPTFEEIVEERLPAMIPLLDRQKKSLKNSHSVPFFEPTQMNRSYRSDSGFTISVRSWMGF